MTATKTWLKRFSEAAAYVILFGTLAGVGFYFGGWRLAIALPVAVFGVIAMLAAPLLLMFVVTGLLIQGVKLASSAKQRLAALRGGEIQ